MEQIERTQFLEKIPVPQETLKQLDIYAALLVEWSEKFNLVAASTLPHIWSRHFLDSAQLMSYIPTTTGTIADIGSGAGFPGMVLAIMGQQDVHMIDGTGKKANFLRHVVETLGLKAVVHQCRVEEMKDFRADIITARALAALPELLKYANRIIKDDTVCLFLKGQSVDSELTESKKTWTFEHRKSPSLSDDSGSVLIIEDLKYKNVAQRRKR